ncbi:serine hydrolase domain-containing protein [Candidatus Viadribacter manganicus]|uniref:Beta-lactamase-related domain-containing protein n=1 Tax=Candidatus Viadribacter manganicus TaxID=1759059 RepID=A0A1B1AMM9_9PROT|nr:serine hydrolase domain-containing protein [Candidatus Viadribacter manganicus]ANP47785.1 hypothetical protein ATE48_18720 [Candidatus Viadribacter manganicus]
MRVIVALLFVAACATPLHPDQRDERSSSAMQSLISQGFTGSVLVACGDDILFAGDYGLSDSHGREPSYWLASISKQFTATAVLKLVEAGRMTLNDPVSRYFPDAPPDKAPITIQQLLTHQSGLTQVYTADGIVDRNEAVRAILGTQLASSPGATFRYSNDNYTLLAAIVEIVSGERFEDFVRANVFLPAGMRNAGFWPDVGESFSPPVLSMPVGAMAEPNWGFRGGTGMRASVRDLHRWTRALDEGRVLRRESVALLYGPHLTASDGDGVGFGWFSSNSADGRLLWTRGSEDYGPNVILYRRTGTPLTIIAATNAGPAEADGPGWSRRARDALMPIFDAAACN